jgi:hypothetical protein
MDSLAQAFDQPFDSPEHRALAEEGWLGGAAVTVRYRLGRLLQRNFFRETDDSVKAALKEYLVDRGCERGANLVYDVQAWSSGDPLAASFGTL